jgi:hypothetical protein
MRGRNYGLLVSAVLLVTAGPMAAAEHDWQGGVMFATVPADRGLASADNVSKLVPGAGIWAAYSPAVPVALEAEVDGFFPQQELGLLGGNVKRKLLAVAGVRTGQSFGRLGLFARLRPGLLQSQSESVTLQPVTSNATDFVVDAGATLTYRLSKRWSARLDAGDLFIPSSQRNSNPFKQHNLRLALGLGVAL